MVVLTMSCVTGLVREPLSTLLRLLLLMIMVMVIRGPAVGVRVITYVTGVCLALARVALAPVLMSMGRLPLLMTLVRIFVALPLMMLITTVMSRWVRLALTVCRNLWGLVACRTVRLGFWTLRMRQGLTIILPPLTLVVITVTRSVAV